MVRRLLVFLVALPLLAMLIGGCGNSDTAKTKANPGAPITPDKEK